MPRVIQDSDDEDAVSDDLRPAAAGEGATASATATSDEASQPIEAVASAATKSTSSSEKLRREIQMAHTALLEPTPGPNRKRRAADDFDIRSSPPDDKRSKPKRARTMEHSSGSVPKGSRGSLKTPSNKQTQATEDSARVSFDWEVPWSSPDAGAKRNAPTQTSGSAAGTRVSELRTADRPGSVERRMAAEQQDELSPHDTIMDTSSSNRAAGTGPLGPPVQGTQFEEHNPNELFPDSTLANTETDPTPNIEKHIEAEKAALAEGGERDTQATEATQATARRNSIDELQPSSQPSRHASQEQRPNRTNSKGMDPTSSGKIAWTKRDPKPTTSHDDRPQSPQQPTSDELVGLAKEQYKPRPSRSRGGGAAQDTATDLTMPAPPPKAKKSRPSRSKTTGFTFASPKSKLLEMGFTTSQADWALMQADGNTDEAINLLTGGTPKGKQGTQKTRKSAFAMEDKEVTANAEEGDAEADMIQLKSMQTRKGQKTVEPAHEEEDEESEDDIVGPRAKKEKEAKGAASTAEARGIESVDNEQAVVAPRSKRKKKGTAPEGDSVHDEDQGDQTACDASEAVETPNKPEQDSQVEGAEEPHVVKKKKGRGRPKKSDAVIEDDEASPSEHESEHDIEEDEPPAQRGKKKGRGRPKKVQQAPAQQDEVLVPESSGKTLAAEAQEQTALQEKNANVSRSEATPAGDHAPAVDQADTAQTPSSKTSEEHRKTSPQKKHSPINKGRVPFKVGLSRRMRIEPLLKIVKKK